jgi:hypothetical protein
VAGADAGGFTGALGVTGWGAPEQAARRRAGRTRAASFVVTFISERQNKRGREENPEEKTLGEGTPLRKKRS